MIYDTINRIYIGASLFSLLIAEAMDVVTLAARVLASVQQQQQQQQPEHPVIAGCMMMMLDACRMAVVVLGVTYIQDDINGRITQRSDGA